MLYKYWRDWWWTGWNYRSVEATCHYSCTFSTLLYLWLLVLADKHDWVVAWQLLDQYECSRIAGQMLITFYYTEMPVIFICYIAVCNLLILNSSTDNIPSIHGYGGSVNCQPFLFVFVCWPLTISFLNYNSLITHDPCNTLISMTSQTISACYHNKILYVYITQISRYPQRQAVFVIWF